MHKGVTVFARLVAFVFIAGNLVVSVSAAPQGLPGRANPASYASASANPSPGNGWTIRSSTAAPQRVDVATLPRVARPGNAPASQLPQLMRNPAAYAAAKKNPKGRPGLAIKQPATAGRTGPQVANFNVKFPGINSSADSSALGIPAPEPPDTQMAVGLTRVFEMVNSTGEVYTKTGTNLTNPFPLDTFFAFPFFSLNFFGNETLIPTDPRVLYDRSNGRWYATVLGYNPNTFDSGVFLGISDTSDPAAGWLIYMMDQENGQICDQPKLGYSSDKLVIGCSLFDLANAFNGALIMVGTKSQGVAHVNMDEDFYGPNTSAFGLVPAQNQSSGAAAYVVYNDNPIAAAAALLSISATPSNVGGTHLAAFSVPMPATTAPPNAPQNGSATGLDSSDDRFNSAVMQGGVIYTSGGTGCIPNGDTLVRGCLRLVEIGLAGVNLIQGVDAGLNGRYLVNPTLGLNSTGDVVLGYSASSATEYPGLEVAIQPAADPNTFVGGGVLAAGTGPYVSNAPTPPLTGFRWGDYGAAAVDPSDLSKIWVAGEFSNGPTNASAPSWGTQIGTLSGRIPSVCTVASLTPDLPSPQAPGTSIVLTGLANCVTGATPDYSFWIKPPGGTLALVQDYGVGNTYTWTGQVTLGTWTLELRTRATVETSKAYDSLRDISYVITATPCSVPTLTANPATVPQVAGTSVLLTASTTCGAPPALYQFWIRTPDHVLHMVQAYSATNTYNWATLNTQIGSYVLEVLVKNTGSLAAYDNYTTIPYSMQLCNAPTLSTTPATSPYISGSGAITLTATGNCAGGTQFEFFYKDPSAVWHLIGSGYGSSNTAIWNADFKAGNYTLQVEIRPVGSTASYITFTSIPFTLTGCGVPTLAPDLASPRVAGTVVTWTATVTCTGTPQYQFYVKSPAGVWTLAQPWGASDTFVWTSPITTGAYSVEVWVRNLGANDDLYDNYTLVPYTLGLCSVPTLSTGAATTPYASGSGAITLTATGNCAGVTQFEFFYKDPGAVWHLIGSGYGASPTAPWNADFKAGNYTLQVEIRPVGSLASYVTYTSIPFTLTGCGLPTLTPTPAGPQPHATSISWQATVTCTGTPEYQFYVKSPAGVWTLVQPWGASDTFGPWTSHAAPGTYVVQVWVRNTGATEDLYDNFVSVSYTLT